jgi:hypothetical protein
LAVVGQEEQQEEELLAMTHFLAPLEVLVADMEATLIVTHHQTVRRLMQVLMVVMVVLEAAVTVLLVQVRQVEHLHKQVIMVAQVEEMPVVHLHQAPVPAVVVPAVQANQMDQQALVILAQYLDLQFFTQAAVAAQVLLVIQVVRQVLLALVVLALI